MKLDIRFILVVLSSLAVMVVVFQSIDNLTQSYMHAEQMAALASESKSYSLPSL